jgi:phenylpyruvate tautomerase PptA (4-oxalocrotonate tautomerase family)
MAQVKIYALSRQLEGRISDISDTLHKVMMQVLELPENKRFHRFFPMENDHFVFPSDRSQNYMILEISMFEGRSQDTKKELIQTLFSEFKNELQIDPQDLEITLMETPKSNWGIRGKPGDEWDLNYPVEI